MAEKVKFSDNSKEFEVFFPEDIDLDKINRVTFFGREFVEIVRCKDCKFYEKGHACDLLDVFMYKMDDWFCAFGERKCGE